MTGRSSIGIFLTSMTVGGAERVALNLSSGLAKEGHDVDLVLVNAKGELLDEVPDSVSVIDLNSDRVLKSLLPLRTYLSNRSPDILYSMMTEPNIIAVLANKLSGSKTKLVISEHNTLSQSTESIKDRLTKAGAWGIYPASDHVIAVSEGVKEDLVRNTRLDGDSISVIYNPVDVESIQELATGSVEHPWLSDDSLDVVLAGGRHEPQKGFDTLLNAFSQIDRGEVRLILFGTGPDTEFLKSKAKELDIEDRVCFPGFIENPFSFMANANVFVLPSEYEGFGLVLIEALACGCPVVSTDCESGPPEILNEGEYGPLVPVGAENEMAKTIQDQIDDPINPEILTNRANDFKIRQIIERYESVFENC